MTVAAVQQHLAYAHASVVVAVVVVVVAAAPVPPQRQPLHCCHLQNLRPEAQNAWEPAVATAAPGSGGILPDLVVHARGLRSRHALLSRRHGRRDVTQRRLEGALSHSWP